MLERHDLSFPSRAGDAWQTVFASDDPAAEVLLVRDAAGLTQCMRVGLLEQRAYGLTPRWLPLEHGPVAPQRCTIGGCRRFTGWVGPGMCAECNGKLCQLREQSAREEKCDEC